MRNVDILDCHEIGCPLVLLYVFRELGGAFERNGYKVSTIEKIEDISNNSIVFMGDIFRVDNPSHLLQKIAPNSIYFGWYWSKQITSPLKHFIHIYENSFKNPLLSFYNSINNRCPLLLRANESPESIGTYEREVKMHYCYMGWRYCPEMVPTKFSGLYHGVLDHNKFMSYEDRKKIYLSSTFALGFQSDENIHYEHVSQRIFEGLAYGCVVLSNSIPACEQTENIVEYVNSKEDVENKITFYLSNPHLIIEKQKKGYEFSKIKGTNQHSMDLLINCVLSNFGNI
jgi:hypothetical protein